MTVRSGCRPPSFRDLSAVHKLPCAARHRSFGCVRYRPRAVPMVAANKLASGSDTAIKEEHDEPLGRAERRLLRRIYNGRTVPITVDGRAFLTHKEASRYLLSLTPDERERVYAAMKSSAANESAARRNPRPSAMCDGDV